MIAFENIDVGRGLLPEIDRILGATRSLPGSTDQERKDRATIRFALHLLRDMLNNPIQEHIEEYLCAVAMYAEDSQG